MTSSQPLPTKEASAFRAILKFYEQKQYKKGLKACDQILKKFPKHGEALAMKGLITGSTGKVDEAFEMTKEALKRDMKSHVCWHVYGLLYRQVNNREEAIKAYRMALRLKPAEPENQQILRDLALMQIQCRDYSGYLECRRTMLNLRPNLRQNWNGLAVAHHLSGEYEQAEKVLTTYEKTLIREDPEENKRVQRVLRNDLEHMEALLYKTQIIAESGDYARALETLETSMKNCADKNAALEMRAEYLQVLGRKEEAEKAFRLLIDRNPDNRKYFAELERILYGEDRKAATPMYEEFSERFSKADAPRRIVLDILEGEEFRKAADKYLRAKLSKGVPSTFANIKGLYADDTKREAIFDLVSSYDSDTTPSSQTNGVSRESERYRTWTKYFLAQHFDHWRTRDTEKALEFINALISSAPESVEFHMTLARIYKHAGNIRKAMETMDAARKLDKSDRYINTKTAKYQLRSDLNQDALTTMSCFTRNDAVGGTLGDLIEMQSVWYLMEDAESYVRQGNQSLALKRYHTIRKIFSDWEDDQFDFHTFSLRRGMIRSYVEMLRWEGSLYSHPHFVSAALGAIDIYLTLAEKPRVNGESLDTRMQKLSVAERKKAQRKAKSEQQKTEAARKEAEAKAKEDRNKNAQVATEEKEADLDPMGFDLVGTKDPLGEAMKWVDQLLRNCPDRLDVQLAAFRLFKKRGKWLLALKRVLEAKKLAPDAAGTHEIAITLRRTVNALPSEELGVEVKAVLSELDAVIPRDTDLVALNNNFLTSHSESPEHVFTGLRIRSLLNPESKEPAHAIKVVEARQMTLLMAREGLTLLERLGIESTVYAEKARTRWPMATVFG